MLALAGREADGAILNWLAATDVPRCVGGDRQPRQPDRGADLRLPDLRRRLRPDAGPPAVATYLNVPAYAEFHRWLGRGPQVERMWRRWEDGDRAAAAQAVPDDVVDELVLHGNPGSCRDQVLRYAEAGVQTPVLACCRPETGDGDGLAAVLEARAGRWARGPREPRRRGDRGDRRRQRHRRGPGSPVRRRGRPRGGAGRPGPGRVGRVAAELGTGRRRGWTSPTRRRWPRWSPRCWPSTAGSTCSAPTPASAPAAACRRPADDGWQRAWRVHVLAHVYAARAVLPAMIAAGGGYLLNTASAAGLLSAPGDGLHREQARCGRLRRVAGLLLSGPQHPGQPALPDGRGHPAADGRAGCRVTGRRGRRRLGPVLGVEEVAAAVARAGPRRPSWCCLTRGR